MACIEASSQVELYDEILPEELPCGTEIHTAEPWESDAPTLWDGREWRIHYWKFKPNAENFANLAMQNEKDKGDEDPYADIYDGMPAGLWRERSGVDDDYEDPLF